ncbi:MAG: thermonuclease family protein [Candidatus Omnitrophica bacterium]|nr:thermonuclease family protein [Candidatus Omnitrophota bacterium]
MKIRRELKLIQAAVLAAAVLLYVGLKFLNMPGKQAYTPSKAETGFVARVVDGDTLKLSDGRRVRLVGVDTPELHYSDKLVRDSKRTRRDIKEIQAMGRRSADFTKRLCEGKAIKIETDVKKLDRYGRILAYAYLGDGTFVNAKIIEEGYGQVMTIPPNVKHADRFLKLQQEARGARRGLWAVTDDM